MPAQNLTLYAKWTINDYKIGFLYSTQTLLSQEFRNLSTSEITDRNAIHSLVVTATGQVYAWGNNDFGQLGDGSTIDRTTPTLISFNELQSGERIKSVKAGSSHSIAVTTSGRVYSWGRNTYGQLGNGTYIQQTTPTLISVTGYYNNPIQSVATGYIHSLALSSNGEVYAWGYNSDGSVGKGSNSTVPNPTLINFDGLLNGEKIKSIEASERTSVAVTTSGRVYVWGDNRQGQVGDGLSATKIRNPKLISFDGIQSGETIEDVDVGAGRSLALTTNGRVYTWGGYDYSNDSSNTFITTPTLISFIGLQNGETIQSIESGGLHSLAITTSGRVYSWGSNYSRQLENGAPNELITTPTLISFTGLQSGETIQSVIAGGRHSFAITTDGRRYAWGENSNSILGDGTIEDKSNPTIIDNPYLFITNSINNDITVTYNQTINLTDPILEGYVFVGWFMNEGLTIPYNLTNMPGNDFLLYAKFTPIASQG
jgi:uncharacterized repeat protein (TIGR02543 family)